MAVQCKNIKAEWWRKLASDLFRMTLTELISRRNIPRDACYRVGRKFLINRAGATQCGAASADEERQQK